MSTAVAAPGTAEKPTAVARLRRALQRLPRRIWDAVKPWLALLWRIVSPVLGLASPAGWVILFVGMASLIVARIWGWQEFTYLGATLLGALVIAIPFLIGRVTYAVTIGLDPARVVVGDRALGQLAVSNPGTTQILPSRMELPVGSGVAEFAIPALGPGEAHEELFAVPTVRRAVILAGPAVSIRGDQLGLLRRAVRWTDPVELFVHPRTVRLAPSPAGLVRDLEGQVTKKITNSDISFHALRNYVPGDDRRYVHWRSSARLGQLMVRQFEETRRSQLTMLLSEDRNHYATEDEFELAVSVAASIATQVIRDGVQVSMVSDTRRLHTHTVHAMLDDSCRFELTGRKFKTPREFAQRVTRRLAPPSVAVVIAGSGMAPKEYRSIETVFGADTVVLGFRVIQDAAPAMALAGGLPLVTLGTLEDLPKVLGRAM